MTRSADFYNREYNARSRVPNVADIFARWKTDSASARAASPRARFDLAYGSGPSETLDFFPASQAHAPLFVFIHGGYWRSLDKADFSWVAPELARAGINVAVPNYALAPAVSIEHIVRQLLAAHAWLWRNAQQLGFDRARIAVGGHSAGGHLTAMMMAARWPQWADDLPADLLKGGYAISGLFDLHPIAKTPFLNVDLKLDAQSATRLSPALMPPATRAPLVTSVGGDESSEFLRQNALIGRRWKSVLRADIAMPGHNHFTVCDDLTRPGSAMFNAVLQLCR
jgi:arylformamidase